MEESAGKVAIVGRPNVGKSALFNRLAGRNIAIVHDQPGITRDRLAAPSTRGKRPFVVWDTGGIGGAGENELAAEVRTAADAAMRESDVILFVVDAQHGLAPIDQDLARMLRKSKRPVVLVVNKIDDPKHEALESDFARLGFEHVLPISAAHGRGITSLLETIDELLPEQTSSNGEGERIEGRTTRRVGDHRSSECRQVVVDQRGAARPAHDRQQHSRDHARRGRHRIRARRREVPAHRHGRHSPAQQALQLRRSLQRHARRAHDPPRGPVRAGGRCDQRRQRTGQEDRRPDPEVAQAFARRAEQMGSREARARYEGGDRGTGDGNARAVVLSRLRTGSGRIGRNGREREPPLSPDLGHQSRGARAYQHRHPEPHDACGDGRDVAAHHWQQAAQAVLRHTGCG